MITFLVAEILPWIFEIIVSFFFKQKALTINFLPVQKNKLLVLYTLTLTWITWVDVILEQTKKRGG